MTGLMYRRDQPAARQISHRAELVKRGATQTISGFGFAMPHSDDLVLGWNH
jgi:hypothetical protein